MVLIHRINDKVNNHLIGSEMTDVVQFEEMVCDNGKIIAVATLNAPKSLNALSGDMIALLYLKLLQWQQQGNIVAVFLQGSGDKAFCAGGDIVHLYQAMKSEAMHLDKGEKATADPSENSAALIENYFTKEYQLDFLIHQFKKPFIVWGHGIVMGGGLGLLSGASHRVVTEKSRIAMPEISIGLFPDVGASYFLNQMPSGNGLFLALTGASINACDAKFCQLADVFITHSNKETVLAQLCQVNWSDSIPSNHMLLSTLLIKVEQACLSQIPDSELINHQVLIQSLVNLKSVELVYDAIVENDIDDKWFNRAQKSLMSGSALSAHIAYRQLGAGKNLSLADCFRMELNLAVNSGFFGEFAEGVRALLIDKDSNPSWRFDSIMQVEESVVDWFFEPRWQGTEHPLVHL